MVLGETPWQKYESNSFRLMSYLVYNYESLDLPNDLQISSEIREFICKCTKKEAKERITIIELNEDPFISRSKGLNFRERLLQYVNALI